MLLLFLNNTQNDHRGESKLKLVFSFFVGICHHLDDERYIDSWSYKESSDCCTTECMYTQVCKQLKLFFYFMILVVANLCPYTLICNKYRCFQKKCKTKAPIFFSTEKKKKIKSAIYYHILRLSDELFFVGFAQVTWMRKRYQKPQEESQMQRGSSWEFWEVLIFDPNKSWCGMHKERLRR